MTVFDQEQMAQYMATLIKTSVHDLQDMTADTGIRFTWDDAVTQAWDRLDSSVKSLFFGVDDFKTIFLSAINAEAEERGGYPS